MPFELCNCCFDRWFDQAKPETGTSWWGRYSSLALGLPLPWRGREGEGGTEEIGDGERGRFGEGAEFYTTLFSRESPTGQSPYSHTLSLHRRHTVPPSARHCP